MRINRYVAQATGISRRKIDKLINEGLVRINDMVARPGTQVTKGDKVFLQNQELILKEIVTIALNKPPGYVCSRNGQGSKTIYSLLPPEYQHLKSVGRLDKNSSGLLLLTSDGELANSLTHPSNQKKKVYQVILNKPLLKEDKQRIEQGITLADGPSKLSVTGRDTKWRVTMYEGRNRQIRRTFLALGYIVTELHRTQFGNYQLGGLIRGDYKHF